MFSAENINPNWPENIKIFIEGQDLIVKTVAWPRSMKKKSGDFLKHSSSPLMCLHFWICRKLLQEFKASECGNPHSGINRQPIRADGFRSGSLSARGEGHDCFAHHHAATWTDGWKI